MSAAWGPGLDSLRAGLRADAVALHLPKDGRLEHAAGDAVPETVARRALQRGARVDLGASDAELAESGLAQALAVPLPQGAGALTVGRRSPSPWTQAECALLETRAEAIALRLEVADLRERLGDCELDREALLVQRPHPPEQAHENMAGLSRMARQLGHDLRGPLANLRVALDLLRGADPEDQERLLGRLDSEIGHASRLIGDRVHLTRALEPLFTPISLAAAARQAAMELRRPSDVRLELEVGDAPTLTADVELLTRLLVLLAENAVEALEDGGVVRIVAREVEGRAELRVEDSGLGVPPGLRERVMVPGFTTRDRSGGLGLAICGRIVAAHRGTLHFEDSPLGGAAVVVRLPMQQEIPGAGEKPASAWPSTEPSSDAR